MQLDFQNIKYINVFLYTIEKYKLTIEVFDTCRMQ